MSKFRLMDLPGGIPIRIFLLCCFLLARQAHAQPQDYVSGVHYQELSEPLPDLEPDRIEVMELFWYGCPACYDLLPTFQIWESSYRTTDMSFTRMPVVWNQAMETHARMYLTADELGLLPVANKSSWEVTPTIHNAAFDAMHVDHQALRSPAEISSLFEAWGISHESFEEAWNSDAVAARLEKVKAVPALSGLSSLPALVVHGRYVITFNDAVTTSEDMYKVLNYLVVQTRKAERAGSR